MGNCQAVDAAALVIQHPTGKVEKLYWPITAAEVMKTNPGHYVALLLSTTLYPPTSSNAANNATSKSTAATTTTTTSAGSGSGPVRLTRIKLLRPTDTLTLGHVYRLITNQEVMKGLWAKKQAKLNKTDPQGDEDHQPAFKFEERRKQSISDGPPTILETDESRRRRSHGSSGHPVTKSERNRSSGSRSSNGGSSSLSAGGAGSGSGRSRKWQPSLNSILESAGSSSSSSSSI